MLVATLDPIQNAVAADLVDGPVTRALLHDKSLYRDIIESAKPSWRRTKSGIYVEQGFRVPFDGERFSAPIRKMVRALFYFKSKMPLPKTHKVAIYPGIDFWDKPGVAEVIETMQEWQSYGDTVFQFRSARDQSDPAATVWLLVFYQNIGILAWTLPRANAIR